MKTIKLGCSNGYIILTLVGLPPLIGGAFGLNLFVENLPTEIRFDMLIQSSIFFIFGLLMCTYRSCLYVTPTQVEIRRRLVFIKLKPKIIKFKEIKEILISIRACTSSSANIIHAGDYYGVDLIGYQGMQENVTDFMRFHKKIHDEGSYSRVCSWLSVISERGGIPIVEHEKVQKMDKV